MRMRATADSQLLAAFNGVNIGGLATLAWAISAVCAAAAGVAFTLRSGLDPLALGGLGFLAFPAIVLGGLDSIRGALMGGFLLALLQSTLLATVGGQWADIVSYGLLVGVLLVRPQGLFGVKQVTRL
jgi:branched-chain amino acid transport system permease protein